MLLSRKSFPVAVALLCLGAISPSLPAFAQTEESQNQSTSEPLLSVEGILEPGDATLEDGSFYDSYTFEGRAEQTVTVVLESLEFDTYLLIRDVQEEVIDENDDFSEDNQNSALTVTLPEDGVYWVVANAYDAEGQGRYTLKVTSALSPQEEPVFSDAVSKQAEAEQLLQQGIQQYQTSQFRVALQSWEKSLELYREIGDRAGESASLNNLGNVYKSLGEYEQAIEFYQQSLDILQEIGDRDGESTPSNNLGNVYNSLGQYEKAIEFHQQSLAIDQEIEDRAGEGKSFGNLGLVYKSLGEYEKAIYFHQQSLAIAREIGDREGEGVSLNNLGSVYESLGQYQKAIDFYQKALTIAREIRNRDHESSSLIGLGYIYYSLGKYEKAVDLYRRSLNLSREISSRSRESGSLTGLGNVYDSLGEYQKAIEFHQQSLAIAREIGDRDGESNSLGNLGSVYESLGEYEKAIELHQQSLAIEREIGDRDGESASLMSLGNVYESIGQYEKAIEFHQQSLTIAREISSRPRESGALTGLGNVYESLGQYERAIDFHKQSLAIDLKINNRPGASFSLNNLGNIYYSLGKYQQAVKLHQQSLAIDREISNRAGESASLNNLGNAYESLGEYEKAIEVYQQSLTIARDIGDRDGESNSLNNLGIVYESLGQYEKAIEFHQQSLAIEQEIGDRAGEGLSLNNIGYALSQSGQLAQAEEYLRAGIEVRESIRAQSGGDTNKISIFDIQSNTYRHLQQTLIAQNKTDRALEISERGRARALVELLTRQLNPQSQELPQIDPPSLTEIKQIAQQQNATLVEYSVIPDVAIFIWVIQPTGNVEFRAVDLEKLDGSSLSVEELRNLRQTLEASRGGKPEESALASLVRGTETTLQGDEGDFQEHLQRLHKILIDPIAELLPTNPEDRVIFIPHESLFRVPFAALQDAEYNYLIEKHTILTAPSIQSLALTRQHQERIGATLASETGNLETLIVGNPIIPNLLIETRNFKPLPNAEQEAQDIAKILNATPPLLGNAATETEVVKRLHSANLIHLATHGLFDTDELRDRVPNLNIPGLVALTPDSSVSPLVRGTEGGSNDGFLTAGELVQLTHNNPLNAHLVVLSACETGLGDITGDGVIGLSRALIAAGVPSIVVSFWQVPDASTQQLMTAFYTNLYEKKMDKAQALRQAMLQIMENNPDPGAWSGFTLIGEAE